MTIDGKVLRIDRLLQLDDVWWVLDYKLNNAPHELEAHRDQLRRYRDAVQLLQPGALVCCAFVTSSGEVIEPIS